MTPDERESDCVTDHTGTADQCTLTVAVYTSSVGYDSVIQSTSIIYERTLTLGHDQALRGLHTITDSLYPLDHTPVTSYHWYMYHDADHTHLLAQQ